MGCFVFNSMLKLRKIKQLDRNKGRMEITKILRHGINYERSGYLIVTCRKNVNFFLFPPCHGARWRRFPLCGITSILEVNTQLLAIHCLFSWKGVQQKNFSFQLSVSRYLVSIFV